MELDIHARSLELTAPYIFKQPRFKLIWRDDSLVLSDFSGLLEGGKVSGGLQLENVDGEALLKSHVRVDNTALAPFIWEREGRAVANGLVDLNLTMESQGRSLAGLVSGLSGDGTFALKDAVLHYINPEAFAQVVRAVDAGLELKEADIAKAFISHMDAGSTKVSRLAGTFGIAGGALRANNIEAEADILQSRGNLILDFPAQTISGDWSIKVEPNEEDAVTGAQPEVGLVFSGEMEAPMRKVDVSPFTGYLSIRAFEREVDRVERLQADILEKERMRRLLRLYREQARHREEARLAAEKAAEEARLVAIEEAERQKQEVARKEAERKAAEEKARLAEEKKRRAAEEAVRLAEEAKKAADAAAKDQQQSRQPGDLITGDEPSNQIEIRPLEDLKSDNSPGSGTFRGMAAGAAGEADAPLQVEEGSVRLPDIMIVLPRKPVAPPSPVFVPAPVNDTPATHNELIDQLINSPDRIIQLD